MKKLILFIAVVTLFVACKKENLEPKEVIVEKIVKQTDTVKTSTKDTIKVVVHDTTVIYQTSEPLQSIYFWTVYKIEKHSSSGLIVSTEYPNWLFKFGYNEVIENKGALGSFIYNVKTYLTYIDIYESSKPLTYVSKPINGGKEYILTQITKNSDYNVIFLKH